MILELIDVQDYNDEAVLATVEKTENGVTERVAHLIHKESLEWRAAEYGIDPADTDTLVDLILHEAHVVVEDGKRHGQVPRDEARQAILDTIKAKKAESATPKGQAALFKVGAVKGDPKGKLLSLMHLDPEVVEVKREIVDHFIAREQERVAQVAAAKAFAARRKPDRVSEFKKRLEEVTRAPESDIPRSADPHRP